MQTWHAQVPAPHVEVLLQECCAVGLGHHSQTLRTPEVSRGGEGVKPTLSMIHLRATCAWVRYWCSGWVAVMEMCAGDSYLRGAFAVLLSDSGEVMRLLLPHGVTHPWADPTHNSPLEASHRQEGSKPVFVQSDSCWCTYTHVTRALRQT